MGFIQNIKKKAGQYFLEREGEVKRQRKGFNFSNAQRIALLYEDHDEAFFKKIKNYVKYLHAEHGIRKVMAFGFIDADSKNIPIWHAHKLEFDYFTRGDLNWHLKPSHVIKQFTDRDFDILIDLSQEDCIPLNYVLSHSQAKMKVGRAGSPNESAYDLLISMDEGQGIDQFINQVNFYLSNLDIQ